MCLQCTTLLHILPFNMDMYALIIQINIAQSPRLPVFDLLIKNHYDIRADPEYILQ